MGGGLTGRQILVQFQSDSTEWMNVISGLCGTTFRVPIDYDDGDQESLSPERERERERPSKLLVVGTRATE